MNSFTRNLLLLASSTTVFIAVAAGSTYLVKYKPWGVPDVLRGKYEAKVVAMEQRNELITSWESKDRPIVFVRSFYDLGPRPDQSSEQYTFSIRNNGHLPLTISHSRSSNGASFEFSDQTIQPDQEAIATVAWTSNTTPGPFEFYSIFESNDPLQESFRITFRGRIKAKIMMPQTVSLPASNVGEVSQATVRLTSELWKSFEITDVKSKATLDWHASATEPTSEQYTSCVDLTLIQNCFEYGKHEEKITIVATGDSGETIETPIVLKGRVNHPITFQGPALHMTDGLDIGTIEAGQEQSFHLNCRVNGDQSREIAILDYEPKQLIAKIEKQSRAGNYRLSITVPPDCPLVVFNSTKQGFVKVGDPNDDHFSNWLPIHGVVVPSSK